MNVRVAARIILFSATVLMFSLSAGANESSTLLATTFPVYQMTRNIMGNRTALTLDLMLPAELGCPHDYALTPQDMHKLAGARALIINGLGLEEFLGAPIRQTNPAIAIIDSTAGIGNLIGRDEQDGHDHAHNGHDDHHGVNPHLFASPRMAARMVMTIEKALSSMDPSGQAVYAENARAYEARLNDLALRVEAAGKHLINRRIVTQHGIFDYLARDMGLTIVAVISAHGGQEPSAADMLSIMTTIRQQRAGAIFTEPQYPGNIARTLSRETGIPLALLDPGATGPAHAPLDYYETIMKNNLALIEKTLGKEAGEPHE